MEEARKVSIAIRHVLEKLLGEFERSFGFYRQQAPDDKISLIILSGKGAELRDFDKLISARMQLDVRIANPVAGVKPGSSAIDQEELAFIAPRLSASIGLAQKSAISFVNLLPGKVKRAAARRSIEAGGRLSPRQIAAALAVALAALFVVVHIAQLRYEKDVRKIEKRLADLEPVFRLAREKKFQVQQMQEEIKAIKDLRGRQLFWFDILRELSNAVIRDKLWLTKAVFVGTTDEKGRPRFQLDTTGLAFSHSQVTEFMVRLDQSPHFDRVRPENSNEVFRDDHKLVSFTVSSIVQKEKSQ
jgi:hypothetical protein